jgi:hypothetical protein
LNKAVRERRLEGLEAKGVNSWTSKEVGEWIESVGYPQYSTCGGALNRLTARID